MHVLGSGKVFQNTRTSFTRLQTPSTSLVFITRVLWQKKKLEKSEKKLLLSKKTTKTTLIMLYMVVGSMAKSQKTKKNRNFFLGSLFGSWGDLEKFKKYFSVECFKVTYSKRAQRTASTMASYDR